jgi:hypothetical protein
VAGAAAAAAAAVLPVIEVGVQQTAHTRVHQLSLRCTHTADYLRSSE